MWFGRIKPTLEPKCCPACSQRVVLYKRKINATMCHLLMKASEKYGYGQFNVKDIGDKTHEFAKLNLWHLIEPCKGNGNWRITFKGYKFLFDGLEIPRYALVFNGMRYGYDGDRTLTYREIIDTPENFEYEEEVA